MPNSPDGRYDRTKPWEKLPNVDRTGPLQKSIAYLGPFASNEERLMSQALQVALIPGAELAQMVRPPLPQIQLFPPRFGYRQREIGIEDVIDINRSYNPRTDFSGGGGEINSTSRNTQGTGTW